MAENFSDMFAALSAKVQKTQDWDLQQEMDDIRQTYVMMLRFMVDGVNDPDSPQLLDKLIRRMQAVADRVDRIERLRQHHSDKYAIAQRMNASRMAFDNVLMSLETYNKEMRRLRVRSEESGVRSERERESKQEYEEAELIRMHEDVLLGLFESVWSSDLLSKSGYEALGAILESDAVAPADKSVLVSAVTMALLEMFDERKMMLLFDAWLCPEAEVNQRAIVGMVLVLRKYDERMAKYPALQSRLSLFAEDPAFVKTLFRVMMQLQFSKMTDKVSDKMRTDIIPTIMKSRNLKKGMADFNTEILKNDENPEWYNFKSDDKASKKIQEMAEMQHEGADVYMGTFSYMKSYPFFSKLPHWFYPFSFDVPDMAEARKLLKGKMSFFINAMLGSAPFCNSDRYSFCLMLNSVGAMGENMLSKQMEMEMSDEGVSDAVKEAMKRKPKPADISRMYIYDLYRFFKTYPYKQEFDDPFSDKKPMFTPLATSSLSFMTTDREEVLALGEFFMRKGFYADAKSLFLTLHPEETEDDAHLWQKIGFCQQKQGDNRGALSSYLTADSLCPDSQWTIKHIAATAFDARHYDIAERYYDRMLEDDDENLKLLQAKAHCMFAGKRYDEALPLLYKIDYLTDKSADSQTMLAIALIGSGDTDKAETLLRAYVTEHQDNPDADTAVLLAHVCYCKEATAEAYTLYRRLHEQYADTFHDIFYKHTDLLPLSADRRKTLDMMYDAVCFGVLE